MVSQTGLSLSPDCGTDSAGGMPTDELPSDGKPASDAPAGSTETEDAPTCTKEFGSGFFGTSELWLEVRLPT